MRRSLSSDFLKSFVCILVFCCACFWNDPKTQLKSAQNYEEAKQYPQAVEIADKLVKRHMDTKEALDGARIGSRVSFLETKNYQQALFFYKHLVLYSDLEGERAEAQKRIAEIYFERIGDQNNAVIELNRVLQLPLSKGEQIDYRLDLAKALFYLSQFQQAEVEVDAVIALKPPPAQLFDAFLTKGNIYFSAKQIVRAIDVYKMLLEKFPAKAKDEHVGINLAICYEEDSQFTKAVDILKELKPGYPNPDFIDEKIVKLQERASQAPGAMGLKK